MSYSNEVLSFYLHGYIVHSYLAIECDLDESVNDGVQKGVLRLRHVSHYKAGFCRSVQTRYEMGTVCVVFVTEH